MFSSGGYVYRGTYFADLIGGAYVFGDNTNKNVYYLKEDGGTWTVGTIISDGSVDIIGFAEDNNVRQAPRGRQEMEREDGGGREREMGAAFGGSVPHQWVSLTPPFRWSWVPRGSLGRSLPWALAASRMLDVSVG